MTNAFLLKFVLFPCFHRILFIIFSLREPYPFWPRQTQANRRYHKQDDQEIVTSCHDSSTAASQNRLDSESPRLNSLHAPCTMIFWLFGPTLIYRHKLGFHVQLHARAFELWNSNGRHLPLRILPSSSGILKINYVITFLNELFVTAVCMSEFTWNRRVIVHRNLLTTVDRASQVLFYCRIAQEPWWKTVTKRFIRLISEFYSQNPILCSSGKNNIVFDTRT